MKACVSPAACAFTVQSAHHSSTTLSTQAASSKRTSARWSASRQARYWCRYESCSALPALPCPSLPCPALPCPALRCPALRCPASISRCCTAAGAPRVQLLLTRLPPQRRKPGGRLHLPLRQGLHLVRRHTHWGSCGKGTCILCLAAFFHEWKAGKSGLPNRHCLTSSPSDCVRAGTAPGLHCQLAALRPLPVKAVHACAPCQHILEAGQAS